MKAIPFALRFAVAAPLMLGLAGCFNFLGLGGDSVPPAERQLPAAAQAQLTAKGMRPDAPILIRIFKEESELEVWKLKDGRFQHFKTYPICAWSGGLGPKVQQGDRQAPEGFYTISRNQLNPHSLYYLSMNIGFPNAYDRANGHTGSALMIHGDCKSAGCYAMTDAYIEEIYILAREAFDAGQTRIHVHAFPFRMTPENMQRHKDTPWDSFWARLKEGYDSFQQSGRPPIVKVCSKQYLVNVQFSGKGGDPTPEGPCPEYAKVEPAKLQSIDGVPQTLLASLTKQETPPAQASEGQPIMTASLQQPPSKPQTAGAPPAEMSASPVITRPNSSPVIANMQPAKPPLALAKVQEAETRPAPARVIPPSSAQPVSFQIPASPQPVPVQPAGTANADMAEQPSKTVEPDALQKPNRSGKGGKLSMGPAAAADSGGGDVQAPQR
ncbi:MAG TPA: L,D-transpeptidase family protein [Hyphomicrobiales bacterium]|nr:L,D-transpeptidase family protein [Hyphomicrobiales bacterium]